MHFHYKCQKELISQWKFVKTIDNFNKTKLHLHFMLYTAKYLLLHTCYNYFNSTNKTYCVKMLITVCCMKNGYSICYAELFVSFYYK